MNKDPLVSVVLPTYNRSKELKRAINSVLSQTYGNFELFVIDDGSTDNTQEVLDNFEDERIEHIRFEKNRGPQIARNTGIENSSGKFIALLDDDDVWTPDKLEKQVKKFRNLDDSWGVVYSGLKKIRDGKVVDVVSPGVEGWVLKDILLRNRISSSMVLLRSDCLEEVGLFDPNLESSQDVDLWIRLAKDYKFSCVDEPLAIRYIEGEDRISKNYRKRYEGVRGLLEKHFQEFKNHPKGLSRRYSQLGTNLTFLTKSGKKSRPYFKKAILADKTNYKAYLDLILSYLSSRLHRHIYSLIEEESKFTRLLLEIVE